MRLHKKQTKREQAQMLESKIDEIRKGALNNFRDGFYGGAYYALENGLWIEAVRCNEAIEIFIAELEGVNLLRLQNSNGFTCAELAKLIIRAQGGK